MYVDGLAIISIGHAAVKKTQGRGLTPPRNIKKFFLSLYVLTKSDQKSIVADKVILHSIILYKRITSTDGLICYYNEAQMMRTDNTNECSAVTIML